MPATGEAQHQRGGKNHNTYTKDSRPLSSHDLSWDAMVPDFNIGASEWRQCSQSPLKKQESNRTGAERRQDNSGSTSQFGDRSPCHGFPHKRGKVADILFRRIERAHPAHHGLLFVPNVKEITVLYLLDSLARDAGEHTVRLYLVNDLHIGNLADFFFQQFRHTVGVLGVRSPEIVC